MARLDVWLLGPFRAELDGATLSGFSAAKVRGLLAFLAIDGAQRGREALAGLLWPDEPQEVAQANLRQALANLRQVIGDRAAATPLLVATREGVGFAPGADFRVDASDFAALVEACRTHKHRRVEACEECIPRLEAARDLYRGDFLAELFVSESPEFEEWMLLKREELRESFLWVLSALAAHYLLTGNHKGARDAAARQLELDPWREEAHRQLMHAQAASGNRSAALTQYETCRRALSAEFGAEPSDETRALFEQLQKGRPGADLASPRRNWPAPVTSFVGRKRELAELARRLQDPSTRLVTVTGLGGVGKSRLLVEAGARLAHGFADGACYVQLSGVPTLAAVARTVIVALGAQPSNPTDPLSELVRSLNGSEVLLVLDNCEREHGHEQAVAALLAACPRLTIVAAGSEELRLQGEWVLRLDGLSTSARMADAGAAAAGYDGDDEAPRLFTERMQRDSSAGPLSDGERCAIRELCERLGGLPLAIELAAAWTSVLSCAEIVAELGRSRRFLDVQQPDPGCTLSAIVEHAWLLLPHRDQHVFRQLAVFEGGFRRAEAKAVVEPAVQDAESGSPGLDASLRLLVSRSLLRLTQTGRYRLHPLVRDFAAERLAEAPEQQRLTQMRHATVYLGLLAVAGPDLVGAGQQAVLGKLGPEIDNVEAAWHHALESGALDLVAGAAGPLSQMFDLLSRSSDAVRLLDEAAEAVEWEAGDERRYDCLCAELLAETGMHYYCLHELTVARTLFERSLMLLSCGEMRVRSLALHGLGNTLFWQGDVDGAKACYLEALDLARSAHDEWRKGCLTYLLGDCASVRGEHAEAMAHYDEALTLFRALGDPRMTAVALSNLGDGYRRQGLLAEARAMYVESLALSEAIGHRRLQSNNHNGLGEVAYDEGDLTAAAEHYAASQRICRAIGSHSLGNLNLVGLAHVACRQRDPRQARMYLREAVRSISEHAGWGIFPVAVTAAAHILACGDRHDRIRAAALLSQVLCHPTTWEDYRHRAMRLFMELQAGLSDEVVAEAIAAGVSVRPVLAELLAFELPEDAPELKLEDGVPWFSWLGGQHAAV